MSLFRESGLQASGYKEKMRLCDKCGVSLNFIPGQGFCCPRGHGCEWPKEGEQKIIREPASAIYAGGAIEYKGQSKGRKRKKPPKKEIINNIYDRP
mgnify:CR=1 FL=1